MKREREEGAGKGTQQEQDYGSSDSVVEDLDATINVAGVEVELGIPIKKRRKLGVSGLQAMACRKRIVELCKANDMMGALDVYNFMKQSGVRVDQQVFNILLAVCGGVSEGKGWADADVSGSDLVPDHGGSARAHPSAARIAVCEIFDDMKALHKEGKGGAALGESCYTALIRALCNDKHLDRAVGALEEMKGAGVDPRLRSYSAIWEACVSEKRMQTAIDLWRGASKDGLTLGEKEYLLLLKVCAAAAPDGDPSLLQNVASVLPNYMEDVLVPGSVQSWEVLKALFRSLSAVEDGQQQWKLNETAVSQQGSCACCKEMLKSIEVSEADKSRLLTQVDELVSVDPQRKQAWSQFLQWLSERGKDAFSVLLDGANIGYFKKGAGAGKTQGGLADLLQIDCVVREYEERGKKVLIVLHSRHLAEKKLSPQALAVATRWREKNQLYACPPRNNDDWYWLYAAVWLEGRALIVTNDKMRDHHFSMLSHRSFLRWRERHQVTFGFGPALAGRERKAELCEPPVFSRRTQVSMSDCDGEESSAQAARAWHFPLEGQEQWLCARLGK